MERFAYVCKFCIYAKFAHVCKSLHVYRPFVICLKDISIALLWHEEASVAEQAGLGPNWSEITKGRLPRDNVFQ